MQILCFNQMFKDKIWNQELWHLLKNLYGLCSNHFNNWWAVLLFFCSFLSGHCLSKQERGTWPQEILWKLCWWSTNMSASSEELCQLGFAMMYSWLHQTYCLNQVASNHQYRNQPLLKVFFVECGNGNVFLCHFSCSWHSLNRHIQMTSAFAVFSIPNSPSFAILHFTFDMRQKNITWQFHLL